MKPQKRLLMIFAVLVISLGLTTAALAAADLARIEVPIDQPLEAGLPPAPLSRPVDRSTGKQAGASAGIQANRQAVNPGFSVDLTRGAVWGLVGPGDVVTVTRTAGGAAYGAAQADGVGFFWMPIYDGSGNGQPVSLLGGNSLAFYINGALADTVTPMTITGGIDVLADQISGNIDSAGAGVPVTITVSGAWDQPPAPGAPLQATTTDLNGDFSVTFTNIDLGANNLVAVDYFDSGNYVRAYLYPNPPVFLVQQYNTIGGYAPRFQNIHATVYLTYPSDIRWEGNAWADWPYGWYQLDGVDVAPGDVVELSFDDSTVISQTVADLSNLSFDTDTEELSGNAPDGAAVLANMWQWNAAGDLIYTETQDTAASGTFTAAFGGDLRPRDEVLVSIADANGHQTQLRSGPPFIDAYMDPTSNMDCIMARVDGPNLPITYTLDTGSEIFTRTAPIGPSDAGNSLQFCYLMRGPGWGSIDFSPGNTITLRTPFWTGQLVLAEVSWQADTAGDAITGEAPAGEIEATVRQWYDTYYPINGAATRLATANPTYSADFSGFDVRDGGTVDLRYFDPASGFATHTALAYETMRYFEVDLPWGVGGWTHVAGEVITATLYAEDGLTLLGQTSHDWDDSPWSFWYDEFAGEPLSPGRWIELTNGSDWQARLQIPEMTIDADADTDLIWGEAPKTLLKIAGGNNNSGFDWFVPVDGYALNTSAFGHDLQEFDDLRVTYQAPDGNRVQQHYFWPQVRMDVDYAHNLVEVQTSPGAAITVTVEGKAVITGTSSADGWFRTQDWSWLWSPEHPDITPGDVITAEAINSEANHLQATVDPVGQIDIQVNYDTNVVTGTIHASWFTGTLTVGCEVWEWGAPGIYTNTVPPDSGQIVCDFEEQEYDLPPWQTVAVRYIEPDGDSVINIWRQPRIEANYAHDWVQVQTYPSTSVTVTLTRGTETYTVTGTAGPGEGGWFQSNDWSPWNPGVDIGDVIVVETLGRLFTINPVGQIDIEVNYETNVVTGTIHAAWFDPLLLNVGCEVWEWDGPSIYADNVAADGGQIVCDFDEQGYDLQPGPDIAVRYNEPDGDSVINIYRYPSMDVNYAHDWVLVQTNPGVPVTVTLTRGAETYTVTGTAEGDNWFRSHNWAWLPWDPGVDIGDVIVAEVLGNFITVDPVGQIDIEANYDTNVVTGTIHAAWFTGTLNVGCDIWEDGGPDGIYTNTVPADGGQIVCDFDERGWDLQPGQNIAVRYNEPDGDSVINVYREPMPDLWVNKATEGNPQVMPGGPVVYTLSYRNDGDATANTFIISDTLPVSTTYLTDTSGVSPIFGAGWVAWNFGPLDPGEEGRFHLVLVNSANHGDSIHNDVYGFTENDSNPGNNHESSDVTVHSAFPDLYVSKNPVPGDPAPGQTMLWEINYGNNGPVQSGPVTLTETLPLSTSVVGWYSENDYTLWDDSASTPGQLVLTAPTIPGYWGDRILLRLLIDPAVLAGTQLTNTVEITTAAELSTTVDNNYHLRNDVWVNEPRWDATVWKNFNWATLAPGYELEYHIGLRNHGNMATNLVLTDTLPAGTTFVEAWPPPTDMEDGFLYWDFGGLSPGEWRDINVRLRIDTGTPPGTEITNCAEVAIDGPDGNLADNIACVTDTVRESGPNLRITKDAYWNWAGSLHYDVVVSNIGTTALYSVTITDTLPLSTSFSGNWWHNWSSSEVTFTDLGSQLVWNLNYIEPTWNWYLSFDVDLDGSLIGVLWLPYTNTIAVPISEDVYPEDNYDEVVIVSQPDQPVWMRVNYAHDWVGGNYPAGRTFTVTVRDEFDTIKGVAEVESIPGGGWGGDGFETGWEDWGESGAPDIQPGDSVEIQSNDGYANTILVGEILGTIDLDNDSISGTVYADWFSEDLYVDCSPWIPGGAPGKNSTAAPDGSTPYFCQWDPNTEWDVQPGQDLAVMYVESDQDRVINVFRDPAPDLRVEKWVFGSDNAMPGGPMLFTIYYRNDGDAAADFFTITDTLPASTTYVSDSSGIIPITGTGWVAWSFGPLDPGEEGSFQIVLQNSANPGDWLQNQVDVVAAYDSNPGNNHAEAWVFINNSGDVPNLYVSKNPVPGDPAPGQTMLWEINYGNNGPVQSGPVTLTETLPLSTSVVGWYSENDYTLWDDSASTPGQLVLTAPTIPGYWGDRILLRLLIDPAVLAGTQLTNTVEITTAAELSTTVDNNYHLRNDVWTAEPRWDAAVWKNFNWGTLAPGYELEYHIGLRNHGNMATNLVLTDTLPAGTTFVEAWPPPTGIVGGVIYWNMGLIEPGEWRDINVRVRINNDTPPDTEITNCAELAIDGPDSNPADNIACVTDFVRESGPNLRITKDAYWNWAGSIHYDVTVWNIGTTALYSITITDTLPLSTVLTGEWDDWGVPFADLGSQLVWNLNYIEPTWSWHASFDVDLDGSLIGVQGLAFTNTITAPVPEDVYPEDNDDEAVAVTGPDVFVEKWLSGGDLLPGEIVTFTVMFGNQNPWPYGEDYYSSRITDTLPAGTTFITATAPWNPDDIWYPDYNDGATVAWGWGTMWSSNIWYYDIVVYITDTVFSGDVLTNHIEAYSTYTDDIERDWGNNAFDLPFTILNLAPELGPIGNQEVDEETLLSFTASVTDVAQAPNTLAFSLDAGAPAGAGIDPSTGFFTWTPTEAQGPGVYTVTVRVSDGELEDFEIIIITVHEANVAPVLGAIGDKDVNEEIPLSFTASATDADLPTNTLTFTLDTGAPAGAAIHPVSGVFTWTPTEAQGPGVYPVTVTVTDNGLPALDDFEAFTITVHEVNDAPVAADDVYTTTEDTTLVIAPAGVLENDSDADLPANVLSAALNTPPTDGSLTLAADGSFVYTPTLNYNGVLTFTYFANDGALNSNLALVTIHITPVNDAPVADDQAITTDEDTPYSGALTASDVDGDPLEFGLDTAPLHGLLSIALDGSFSYTPTLNYNGPDVFTFTVTDGSLSDLGRVEITVNPVNDAPVADDQAITTDEDTPYSGALTASDVDGDPLEFGLDTAPLHGTLSIALDGSFTYTPTLNYNGPDVFTFTVTDGSLSDLGRVEITVNPVNDAPVADDQAITTDEDIPYSGALTASDVDGDPLEFGLDTAPLHGTLSIALDGSFTYTPTLNYNGPDVFTFTVTDGSLSDLGRVEITVNPVNDAPVADDQAITTDEDIPYSGALTASDVDGDPLEFGLDTAPLHGTLSIALDGSFTYTPTLDYNGPDVFTFTVTDGSLSDLGRVEITVNPVNDAPVADDQAITTDEDIPYSGALTASDVDGDPLEFGLDTAPLHGTLSIALDGSFTYTPTLNYNGPDVFTFTVTDGSLSDLGRVEITVNPVNDAPVADDQAITTDEDIPYSGALTASDVDGDPLEFGLDTAPLHGTLSIALDGSFTYTPTLDYNGPDVFTFTVTDGSLSDLGRVEITVNPVNDAPVADDQAITTDEDTPYSGALTASDVDGDPLEFGLDTAPLHGTLSIALDGSFTYTPTLNYNGPDVFTFTVTDGDLSDLGRVDITVNPVNDAPVVDAGEDVDTFEGDLVQFNGTYTDPGRAPQDVTITWHFGDGITTTGTLTPTHTYADDGIYTVTLTVDDGEGGVASDSLLVTVDNVAPVLEPISDQSIIVGEVLTLTAAYSDPGILDTHRATIDWGDGYTATIDLDAGLTGFDFAHAFNAASAYTVTVIIMDDDGGSDTITFSVNVQKSGYFTYLPTIVKK